LLLDLLKEQVQENLRDERAVRLQGMPELALISFNTILARYGLAPIPAGWTQTQKLPALKSPALDEKVPNDEK